MADSTVRSAIVMPVLCRLYGRTFRPATAKSVAAAAPVDRSDVDPVLDGHSDHRRPVAVDLVDRLISLDNQPNRPLPGTQPADPVSFRAYASPVSQSQ